MGHLWNLWHSKLREHAKRGTGFTHSMAQAITKEPPRSPHWPTIEKRWRKAHPDCEACGSLKHVQVHHRKSFKLDPALELHDGTNEPPATPPPDGKPNFISLCMDTHECHLKLGHGGNFLHGGYNPNITEDAAAMAKLVKAKSGQAEIEKLWEKAKAARTLDG